MRKRNSEYTGLSESILVNCRLGQCEVTCTCWHGPPGETKQFAPGRMGDSQSAKWSYALNHSEMRDNQTRSFKIKLPSRNIVNRNERVCMYIYTYIICIYIYMYICMYIYVLYIERAIPELYPLKYQLQQHGVNRTPKRQFESMQWHELRYQYVGT